jgi:hypothetical protein
MSGSSTETRLRVANEFATVDVRLQQVPSGVVLEVYDPQSGAAIWLDALELEALTRLRVDQRRDLVDPSGGRSANEVEETNGKMVGW